MKETLIGWTHSTINGSSGCDGCELWDGQKGPCYAAAVHQNRLAHSLPALYAPSFNEVRMIPGRYQRAADWGIPTEKENADKPWMVGRPRHIFVGDMGDFLSEAVTDEFLERELLGAIRSKNGQRHIWQLLTKRPKRLAELAHRWGGLPDNVVAMTTVTSQRTADVRIPWLLRVQCKTRGVSIEPLLKPLDFNREASLGSFDCCAPWLEYIHWGIIGCESGARRRPLDVANAIALKNQFGEFGAAFFVKQLEVCGKVTTDVRLFPVELQVRQMPEAVRA